MPEERPPIEEAVRILRRLRREAGVPPAHALKSRPCRTTASSVPSDTAGLVKSLSAPVSMPEVRLVAHLFST